MRRHFPRKRSSVLIRNVQWRCVRRCGLQLWRPLLNRSTDHFSGKSLRNSFFFSCETLIKTCYSHAFISSNHLIVCYFKICIELKYVWYLNPNWVKYEKEKWRIKCSFHWWNTRKKEQSRECFCSYFISVCRKPKNIQIL